MANTTAEYAGLSRIVCATPGGSAAAAAAQPWAAVTPTDAIQKMDAILELIHECAGVPDRYQDTWETEEKYRPFVVNRQIADSGFHHHCERCVIPAWFFPYERLASNELARFLNAVMDATHHLPFVTQPEGSTHPVSWFRSREQGFWESMRPSTAERPPFWLQDVSAGLVLRRPLGRSVGRRTMGPSMPPDRWFAQFNGVGGEQGRDLRNLLRLVVRTDAWSDEDAENLVSRAVDAHLRKLHKQARKRSASQASTAEPTPPVISSIWADL